MDNQPEKDAIVSTTEPQSISPEFSDLEKFSVVELEERLEFVLWCNGYCP
jgi:hypothetical protein